MGWTFQYGKPHDVEQEIRSLFTPADPTSRQYEILKLSRYGSTWYAAVRTTYVHTGQSEVWAAVILTKVDKGDWGYKDMEESMGPNEANAPISLIKLLDPTDNEYAMKWRERCVLNAKARSRKPKGPFKTKEPLNFGTFTAQHFEKVNIPRRRGLYRALDANNQLVRLSARHLV